MARKTAVKAKSMQRAQYHASRVGKPKGTRVAEQESTSLIVKESGSEKTASLKLYSYQLWPFLDLLIP